MTKATWITCAVTAFVVACGGGGSGVSSSKRLSDVTDAEARDLCEYANDAFGPARTVTCDGQTVEVGGEETDCSTATGDDIPETCTATVGDFEDCMDLIADDPCILLGEPTGACAFLAEASCSGA